MKLAKILAAPALCVTILHAQNLVPNGDFEGPASPWTLYQSNVLVSAKIEPGHAVGFEADDRALVVRITLRPDEDAYVALLSPPIDFPRSGLFQWSFAARRPVAMRGSVIVGYPSASADWWSTAGHDHAWAVGVPFAQQAAKNHYYLSFLVRERGTGEAMIIVDDLMLREVTPPVVVHEGPDSGELRLWERNTGDLLFGFVALQKLSPPHTVPGLNGAWVLDPWRDGGLVFIGWGVSQQGMIQWTMLPQLRFTIDRTLFFQAVNLTRAQIGSHVGICWR